MPAFDAPLEDHERHALAEAYINILCTLINMICFGRERQLNSMAYIIIYVDYAMELFKLTNTYEVRIHRDKCA